MSSETNCLHMQSAPGDGMPTGGFKPVPAWHATINKSISQDGSHSSAVILGDEIPV